MDHLSFHPNLRQCTKTLVFLLLCAITLGARHKDRNRFPRLLRPALHRRTFWVVFGRFPVRISAGIPAILFEFFSLSGKIYVEYLKSGHDSFVIKPVEVLNHYQLDIRRDVDSAIDNVVKQTDSRTSIELRTHGFSSM